MISDVPCECPICGAHVCCSAPAVISPFLRDRCLLSPSVEAKSHLCELCDHVFFTPILSDVEVQHLYTGYRGHSYNESRLRFEPDYQHTIREFSDIDSAYHSIRRSFYDDFHADRFSLRGLVVDAGDGEGYFGRYAYPHADVVTFARVGETPGAALPDVMASADVLFMAHSLQQSPRPVAALTRLTRWMRPGVEAWLEIPIQYSGSLRASFETQNALAARGARPSGPLATLHENLSHYSVRSLRRLCAQAGLIPIELVKSSIGVLGVLARRSTERIDEPSFRTACPDRLGSDLLRDPHD